MKKALFLKSLSLSLSIVYFTTQIALGNQIESNFWAERKRGRYAGPEAEAADRADIGRDFSQNVALLRGMEAPVYAAIGNRTRTGAGVTNTSVKSLMDAVPLTHATLQETSAFSSDRAPVLIIQDVHMNAEAQTNISEVLSRLIESKQIGAVGVEGAFQTFDFKLFREGIDRKIVRKVAASFVDNNRLAAPSYAGIVSATEPPAFIGIDDREHYDANVIAYLSSRDIKPAIEKRLADLRRALTVEKARVFSPELKRFDGLSSAYHQGSLGLGPYAKALSAMAPASGALKQFIAAYDLEKSLNFTDVEAERKTVLSRLARALNERESSNLVARSLGYRMGRVSFGDYYGELKDLLDQKGVALHKTPAFESYLRYALLADGINADALFEEIERLEAALCNQLATGDDEKRLLKQSERLDLTQKLVDFSLTPKEWEKYSEGDATPLADKAGKTDFDTFEEFYRQADIRSLSMVRAITGGAFSNDKPSVMIVGGFHTKHLTKLLRDEKIPYVVVSPKITEVETASGSAYLSVFARDKTPLEELFAGEKLFLAPEDGNIVDEATRAALYAIARAIETGSADVDVPLKEKMIRVNVDVNRDEPGKSNVQPSRARAWGLKISRFVTSALRFFKALPPQKDANEDGKKILAGLPEQRRARVINYILNAPKEFDAGVSLASQITQAFSLLITAIGIGHMPPNRIIETLARNARKSHWSPQNLRGKIVALASDELRLYDRRVPPSTSQQQAARNAFRALSEFFPGWELPLTPDQIYFLPPETGIDAEGGDLGQSFVFLDGIVVSGDVEGLNLELTIIHEMLHKLGAGVPETALNEGLTQYLTAKIYLRSHGKEDSLKGVTELLNNVFTGKGGSASNFFQLSYYFETKAAIALANAMGGDQLLINAYLKNDIGSMDVEFPGLWRSARDIAYAYHVSGEKNPKAFFDRMTLFLVRNGPALRERKPVRGGVLDLLRRLTSPSMSMLDYARGRAAWSEDLAFTIGALIAVSVIWMVLIYAGFDMPAVARDLMFDRATWARWVAFFGLHVYETARKIGDKDHGADSLLVAAAISVFGIGLLLMPFDFGRARWWIVFVAPTLVHFGVNRYLNPLSQRELDTLENNLDFAFRRDAAIDPVQWNKWLIAARNGDMGILMANLSSFLQAPFSIDHFTPQQALAVFERVVARMNAEIDTPVQARLVDNVNGGNTVFNSAFIGAADILESKDLSLSSRAVRHTVRETEDGRFELRSMEVRGNDEKPNSDGPVVLRPGRSHQTVSGIVIEVNVSDGVSILNVTRPQNGPDTFVDINRPNINSARDIGPAPSNLRRIVYAEQEKFQGARKHAVAWFGLRNLEIPLFGFVSSPDRIGQAGLANGEVTVSPEDDRVVNQDGVEYFVNWREVMPFDQNLALRAREEILDLRAIYANQDGTARFWEIPLSPGASFDLPFEGTRQENTPIIIRVGGRNFQFFPQNDHIEMRAEDEDGRVRLATLRPDHFIRLGEGMDVPLVQFLPLESRRFRRVIRIETAPTASANAAAVSISFPQRRYIEITRAIERSRTAATQLNNPPDATRQPVVVFPEPESPSRIAPMRWTTLVLGLPALETLVFQWGLFTLLNQVMPMEWSAIIVAGLFAASHTIVAWLARSDENQWDTRRELGRFALRFALSIVFTLPFYFDLAKAGIFNALISYGTHGAYNALALKYGLPTASLTDELIDSAETFGIALYHFNPVNVSNLSAENWEAQANVLKANSSQLTVDHAKRLGRWLEFNHAAPSLVRNIVIELILEKLSATPDLEQRKLILTSLLISLESPKSADGFEELKASIVDHIVSAVARVAGKTDSQPLIETLQGIRPSRRLIDALRELKKKKNDMNTDVKKNAAAALSRKKPPLTSDPLEQALATPSAAHLQTVIATLLREGENGGRFDRLFDYLDKNLSLLHKASVPQEPQASMFVDLIQTLASDKLQPERKMLLARFLVEDANRPADIGGSRMKGKAANAAREALSQSLVPNNARDLMLRTYPQLLLPEPDHHMNRGGALDAAALERLAWRVLYGEDMPVMPARDRVMRYLFQAQRAKTGENWPALYAAINGSVKDSVSREALQQALTAFKLNPAAPDETAVLLALSFAVRLMIDPQGRDLPKYKAFFPRIKAQSDGTYRLTSSPAMVVASLENEKPAFDDLFLEFEKIIHVDVDQNPTIKRKLNVLYEKTVKQISSQRRLSAQRNVAAHSPIETASTRSIRSVAVALAFFIREHRAKIEDASVERFENFIHLLQPFAGDPKEISNLIKPHAHSTPNSSGGASILQPLVDWFFDKATAGTPIEAPAAMGMAPAVTRAPEPTASGLSEEKVFELITGIKPLETDEQWKGRALLKLVYFRLKDLNPELFKLFVEALKTGPILDIGPGSQWRFPVFLRDELKLGNNVFAIEPSVRESQGNFLRGSAELSAELLAEHGVPGYSMRLITALGVFNTEVVDGTVDGDGIHVGFAASSLARYLHKDGLLLMQVGSDGLDPLTKAAFELSFDPVPLGVNGYLAYKSKAKEVPLETGAALPQPANAVERGPKTAVAGIEIASLLSWRNVSTILVSVVLAPVWETLVFQDQLGAAIGLPLASLVFIAAHVLVMALVKSGRNKWKTALTLAVPSMLFALPFYFLDRESAIYTAMLLHFAYNAIAVAVERLTGRAWLPYATILRLRDEPVIVDDFLDLLQTTKAAQIENDMERGRVTEVGVKDEEWIANEAETRPGSVRWLFVDRLFDIQNDAIIAQDVPKTVANIHELVQDGGYVVIHTKQLAGLPMKAGIAFLAKFERAQHRQWTHLEGPGDFAVFRKKPDPFKQLAAALATSDDVSVVEQLTDIIHDISLFDPPAQPAPANQWGEFKRALEKEIFQAAQRGQYRTAQEQQRLLIRIFALKTILADREREQLVMSVASLIQRVADPKTDEDVVLILDNDPMMANLQVALWTGRLQNERRALPATKRLILSGSADVLNQFAHRAGDQILLVPQANSAAQLIESIVDKRAGVTYRFLVNDETALPVNYFQLPQELRARVVVNVILEQLFAIELRGNHAAEWEAHRAALIAA